jgi:sodium pump decarboxylase gamma subunit
MLNQLLTVTSELEEQGYPKHIGIGEAAIDALLGFIIVFIGIALLVGVVWLVGYVIQKTTKKASKANKAAEKNAEQLEQATTSFGEEELTEETVAVITAAIMAYYAKEKPECEFTVKRIKRL